MPRDGGEISLEYSDLQTAFLLWAEV
jgi:hypothetical protein